MPHDTACALPAHFWRKTEKFLDC